MLFGNDMAFAACRPKLLFGITITLNPFFTESNKLVFVRDCLVHAIDTTCLRSGPNRVCILACVTGKM